MDKQITKKILTGLVTAYRGAERRLLLLDYDGTLMPLMPTPPEAVPTKALIKLLTELAADPRNTVVVISGRDQPTMDQWLGQLPIGFSAEHGYFLKLPGRAWKLLDNEGGAWKAAVRFRLEEAVRAVPQSFIEEKQTSLVWHHRLADPKTVKPVLAELQRDLPGLTPAYCTALYGKSVVEVRLRGQDKGTAATRWLGMDSFDFVLGAGDDVTDEAMFAALHHETTIKVGPGPTAARYRASTVRELRQLLNSLIA